MEPSIITADQLKVGTKFIASDGSHRYIVINQSTNKKQSVIYTGRSTYKISQIPVEDIVVIKILDNISDD